MLCGVASEQGRRARRSKRWKVGKVNGCEGCERGRPQPVVGRKVADHKIWYVCLQASVLVIHFAGRGELGGSWKSWWGSDSFAQASGINRHKPPVSLFLARNSGRVGGTLRAQVAGSLEVGAGWPSARTLNFSPQGLRLWRVNGGARGGASESWVPRRSLGTSVRVADLVPPRPSEPTRRSIPSASLRFAAGRRFLCCRGG
jgi:hypothetical protein